MPQIALRPEPASVRAARRYVGAELTSAGFDAAGFIAELLVSELVTNAVLHARTPLWVGVEPRGDHVRVTVADESSLVPRPRSHSLQSGTGRGLVLVERLAARWGVEPRQPGKTVWFELPRQPTSEIELWGDILEA